MKKQDFLSIKSALSTPKKIVIITHKNPDGDAIGSSLGFYHYIKQYQDDVCVITPNDYPDFLKWMPAEAIIIKFDAQSERARQKIKDADIIFTLDFNSLSRTEEMMPFLKAAKAIFVMIDHHQQPEAYADYTYSDTAMSSTSEMVYNFITFLDDSDKINADIAVCLYAGIVTDTGSFRFPSTTSGTHRIIADLIDKGVHNAYVHNAIFDTNSLSKIQLLGCALENLTVIESLNTAYITLSKEDLEKYHYKKGDTEGFVNYGLSLKNIKLSAIFIQNPAENHIRISLRSKGDFPVNEIAKLYFSGGGHNNAAGGKSDLPLKETVEKFKNIIAQYKNQLN